MKTLSILSITLLALAGSGCGNDTFLEGLGGALGGNGNNAGGDHEGDDEEACVPSEDAQDAAVESLEICEGCWGPEGEAEALFANVTPEEYGGGALELALVIGDPHGLRDESGAFRVDVIAHVNGIDIAPPADAWRFSEGGTKARVVLLREAGLPAGEYHAGLAVIDGENAADDGETWVVACEDGGEEHPEEGGEGEEGGDHPAEPAD